MERYNVYLGWFLDMAWSGEAPSEEEAIKIALKRAAEMLINEKTGKYYLPGVKLEVVAINGKGYGIYNEAGKIPGL